MKRIIIPLCLGIIIFSGNLITQEDQHLSFLKRQNYSAKKYVIDLFKKHDIVILCEREHKEITQYELFLDIVQDPYFIKNVGHIFTEVGCANLDGEINQFLQSNQEDSVSIRKSITSIFRDIDYRPYWHCYSYPWLLGELYKVNQNLKKDKKLMLHPADIAFDWSTCITAREYKAFDDGIYNRDSIMARQIIRRFDQIRSANDPRKKALVIMNYKHAFLKDHSFLGTMTNNTGRYLTDRYKDKVASVYIMGLAIPKSGSYTIVKNGKWDHYFEVSNHTDVGFNLANSPFGLEVFDVIPPDSVNHLKYQDMFTGLIFYKPVHEHVLKIGWKDFATEEFIPELRRRIMLFSDAMELNMTNEEIEESLLENNIEKTTRYSNLEALRKEIDRW